MHDHHHFPDIDRLSTITAVILLTYSLTAFITIPTQTLDLQLPGFLLTMEFNFTTIVAVIVAVLAAAGAGWLISNHPHLGQGERWHHWIVPAFTALAIGFPLNSMPVGAAWWTIFGFGSLLLTGVLVWEYISVDQSDTRYSFASLALTAITYALLLILVIALRGSNLRLYLVLAAVIPAVFATSTRSIFLRLGGGWKPGWGLGISLIITQLAAGLFYLPLRPIQYGLILIGLTYGLTTLASNIEEKSSLQYSWIEPTVMFIVFTIIGLLVK